MLDEQQGGSREDSQEASHHEPNSAFGDFGLVPRNVQERVERGEAGLAGKP